MWAWSCNYIHIGWGSLLYHFQFFNNMQSQTSPWNIMCVSEEYKIIFPHCPRPVKTNSCNTCGYFYINRHKNLNEYKFMFPIVLIFSNITHNFTFIWKSKLSNKTNLEHFIPTIWHKTKYNLSREGMTVLRYTYIIIEMEVIVKHLTCYF